MLELPQDGPADWYRRKREEAGQAPPAGTVPGEAPASLAPEKSVGDWYAQKVRDRAAVLSGRVAAAKNIDVDRAARVLRAQAKAGGSAELINEMLDEVETEIAKADFNPEKFWKTSPGLARVMSRNEFYSALVQAPGDQAKLANLEQLLNSPKEAWPMPDELIRSRAEKFGAAKAKGYLAQPRLTRQQFSDTGLPSGFEETVEDVKARYPDEAAASKDFVEQEYRLRRKEEDFIAGRAPAGAMESLGRRFEENPLFAMPLWGGIVDTANAKQALGALQAMAAGKATEEQQDLGQRYVRLAAAADRRGTTFMAKAASIFSEMPAFAVEMGTTGPAYRAVKGSAEAGLRSLMKRAVAGKAKELAIGAAGTAAGIGAQSALMMPLRAGEDAARRQMPDAGVDAEGNVQVMPGTGDTPGLAWARAALSTVIETGTERLGGSAVAKWLDKKANRLLFESWAGKGAGRTYEGFRKVLEAGGVNGILGEVGEEEAGKILRAAGGLEEYRRTTLEELGAQALAFGVLPGGAALFDRGRPREFPQTNPEAFRTTAKFVQAMKLVDKAPDQAEKIFEEIAPGVVQYIPIDAFASYYSTQKDEETGAPLDPRDVAAEIFGAPEVYDTALRNGTDLAVPFSRFAVTIGRDQKAMDFFELEMRQDPLERNAREAGPELERRQLQIDAEDRLAKRALERLSQREAEILEEAKKVSKDEARTSLRELEGADLIARVRNEIGRRLYWTGSQGTGKNVEELTAGGIPADMIANPEEAARRGPAYAVSIDEAADRFDMSSDELIAGLAEAGGRRRDLEARVSAGEATEDAISAVWEREFGRVLEEVTAEEAGGAEAARAGIARTIKRRMGVSGFGDTEREQVGELTASVFRAAGERANVSPQELFRQFGPRIRRAASPDAPAIEFAQRRQKASQYNDPNQGSLFDAQGNPNPQAVGGSEPVAPAAPAPSAPEEAPAAAAAPPAAPAPAGAMADVGEQLWYNRRNFFGKGVTWDDIKGENATLKALSAQKTKIWPRPDYEKLVDEGMPPLVAHVVKQVYDSIASKPASSRTPSDEDLKLYLEEVSGIRDAVFGWAKDIQGLEVDWDALAASVKDSPYGMGIMDAISVPKPIDRVYPLNGLEPRSRFRGNAEYNRRALLVGGNKTVDALNVDFRSLKEAAAAVTDGWPAPKEGWERRFEVRMVPAGTRQIVQGKPQTSDRDEWVVVERKKSWLGGRRQVTKGFPSKEEATEAAKQLAAPKKGGAQEEPTVSMDRHRAGPIQRPGGLDVRPKDLLDQFGFRGVNYGNWVNEAERQSFTNQAYDSLADLAEILGVPPKAISLGGLVGLAFGAQGKGGGAAAHFVPGVNEINLTKTKGAGSLAHEWAHALDHYFAVQAGEKFAKSGDPFITAHAAAAERMGNLRPEVVKAFRDILSAMQERKETVEEMTARVAGIEAGARRRLDSWLMSLRGQLEGKGDKALADFDQVAERMRAGELGEGYEQLGRDRFSGVTQASGEIRRLFKDVLGRVPSPEDLRALDANATFMRSVIQSKETGKDHELRNVPSIYASEASSGDAAKGGAAYFSTPWELFARAFQSYVLDKLAEKAQQNDFLTRPQASAEAYKSIGMADRYPRGVEREKINAAFDVLVGAMKTRETERGVELYQADEAAGDRLGGYLPKELTGDVPLISLYKGANITTPFHESGHVYLDLLAHLAGQQGTSEPVKKDFQTLLDWFGVKDLEAWKALSLEERRPHHEKFARGFEAYLMEGNAPSVRLRKAFERFKAWFTWVYKKVDRLKVNLTPEVRRVMDRLVATEAELEEAAAEQNVAPLPAETLKISKDEEKVYLGKHDQARESSREQADRSVMDGVRQTLEALLGEDRAAVRAEVERQVSEEPIYAARAALEKGLGPDGKPIDGVEHVKLSRKDIEERFGGAERWKKIRRYTQAKGGTSPEEAAQRFNFPSAEELLRQLETAPARDLEVERKTDEKMLSIKGAQEVQASQIAEEAMKALHTDERADILAYELGRLASQLGRRHTPVRLAREHAEREIGALAIRDVRPHTYQRGEARAAADALDAALKKDLEGVFDAKERELQNHELYRAAQARIESVEKGVEFVRQAQRKSFRETLGRADFLERWEDLASRFEFFRITRAREEARKGLSEWIRDREAGGDSLGEEVLIPEWVRDETYRTNYRDLTGERFGELIDSFKQIAAMARYNNNLAAYEKRESRDDARAHLISSMRSNMASRPSGARTEGDRDFLERMQSLMRQGDASLLKVEQLFSWLDGGRIDGPWHQYMFSTASKAQTDELDYTARITAKIAKAVNAMPKEIRKRMFEEIEIPGLGRPLTRRTALAIALNAGNASNWRKMLRGESMKRDGLNEAQLRAAIDALSAEEIAYVNSVWDLLESMWPDVEQLHKDLTGVAPPKVITRPYHAKGGTLKGGYYPVMYESSLSQQGQKQAQANFGSLMDEDYAQAKLVSGYRQGREEGFAAPVNLDLDQLPSHLAGVIKDLTWRKWMIDANWITSDRAILAALEEYAGKEYTGLLREWVKRTVNDRNHASLKSLSPWKKFFEGLRFNIMIASMGFKAATMTSQIAGVGPAIEVVGLDRFRQGVSHVLKGAKKAYEEMTELSGEMRHRLETKDRDIRQKLLLLQGKDDLLSQIQDFSLRGIGYADLMVSMPTWWAGYFKGLEEYAEPGRSAAETKRLAVEAGDQAVRLSQGSGGAKDLASVQSRQDTLMRTLTMFYTPFSALYARLRDIGHDYGKTRNGAAAAARLFWVWTFASTVAELASGRGPDDDDDEGWLAWWLKNQAIYPFMTVPALRDMVSAVGGEYGYQFSPVAQALRSVPQLAGDVGRFAEGDLDLDDFAKRVFRASGPMLGLPTGQLGITGEYLLDLVQGDVSPDNLGYFAKDLFFRRPRERNRD